MSNHLKVSIELLEDGKKIIYSSETDLMQEPFTNVTQEIAWNIYDAIKSTGYSEKNILKELIEFYSNFHGLPENVIWNHQSKDKNNLDSGKKNDNSIKTL